MQVLTIRDLARVLVAARVELLSAESTLNTLNVFPVPDGDTGTNMRRTLEAGLDVLGDETAIGPAIDVDRALLRQVMSAMTRGAQGNSGVILSEYLRGFLRCVPSAGGSQGMVLDGPGLSAALSAGANLARGAVHEPVDGTILSVAQAAARAASLLVDQAGLAGADIAVGPVAQAAFDAAKTALERTPQQLAVLADSNVIDAGGAGLVLVLESLARVAGGRHGLPRVSARSWLQARQGGSLHEVGGCHGAEGGPAFEVIGVVEGLDDGSAAELRRTLAACGDSIAVAGGDGVHRVHVHTDQVLAAVSRMREGGRVHDVHVTRFDGPVPGLGDVVVVCRDEVVRAHARALGARIEGAEFEPGDDSAIAETLVLSDAAEPASAQTHHVIGLIRALDERAVTAQRDAHRGAGAGEVGEPGGMPGASSADETADSQPRHDVVWSDMGWDDLDDANGEVEVLRADSWRAARDLVRHHAADAESVVLCVDPTAEHDAARRLVDLIGTSAPTADVEVLRLEMGALVLMEVTHG